MIKDRPGERYAFKRIKSDAAAAKREFSITLDWFSEKCHEPCHYCGRIDRNNISIKSRSLLGGWVVKDFKYNGLDRIDNSVGYTEDNCVPCCAVCNRAKNSMGYNEFIEYLDDLIKFRTSGDPDERDIRDIPLQLSGRGSEARNEVKVMYTQGGYVSENGAFFWPYQVDCYVPWESVYGPGGEHSRHSQEEESDKD